MVSRIAWGTSAIGVAVLCALLVGGLPATSRDVVVGAAGLLVSASSVLLVLRAAAESSCTDTRRAWRWLAAALALVTGGDAAALVGGPWDGPVVIFGVGCILVAYPLVLIGLRAFPTTAPSPLQRSIFWLDTLIVLVGGGLVLWYLAVRTTEASAMAAGLKLAYPVGDLVLFTAAITAARRARRAVTGTTLALIALALLAQTSSDLGHAILFHDPGRAVATWPGAAWLLSRLLLCVAGQAQLIGSRQGARSVRAKGVIAIVGRVIWRVTRRVVRPRLLPLLGLVLGDGLLLVVALGEWPSSLSRLALGAVVLTVLVVARQLVVEREARRSEYRYRSLVQHSSDVITVVDQSWHIRYVSPAATRVFGHPLGAMIGLPVSDFLHPDDLARTRQLLTELARVSSLSAKIACRVRRVDGGWCHTETVVTNQLRVESIGGLVLNTRDVSERTALEERLTHQAYHDPLTGLANRVLFRQRVHQALQRADRGRSSIAVLFVDLDDFKRVNDSLGHAEGDRLLVVVAGRLLNATRGCDTVARLGGDEFAILLENVTDVPDMLAVAERVTGAMRLPCPLSGREVLVGLSMGIARAGEDDGPDDLLRNADVAMYISKNQGKGRHQLFRPEMHEQAMERLELEADMRKTIGGPDFGLRFQPIVELRTGRIAGVEALARWTHPVRGQIPPSTFVPLAEDTGLIVPLGYWVLREACRHAADWQAEASAGAPRLSMTINLSGRQLHEDGLVDEVRSALGLSGLAPASLVLEVTESVMMQDTEVTLGRLHELKELGVQLAIDDFGTGYSSLAYLQRFPIDIMKIDRAFVNGVARSAGDLELVRSILSLADSLGLYTVAEGIEDDAQRAALLRLGCQLGQGFLFARPLVAAEVGPLLRRGTGVAGFTGGAPRLKLAVGAN
ncbi:MAG: putative bifunctional diguanylate cyclase/phosphodiesterase [Gemmatimonadaceae bacterium]